MGWGREATKEEKEKQRKENMKADNIKKKLRLVERLTGMRISKESMKTAIKSFRDKTEEEFLNYLPGFIHEANTVRKRLKYEQEEQEERNKLIKFP